MDSRPATDADWLEWGVAARALPGEAESADGHSVRARGDRALLAVVDGLGHGAEAARAAKTALAVVEEHPDEDLAALVERCHAALAGTRGAVLTLVRLDRAKRELSWVGVGDVEAVLHPVDGRRRESIMLRGGVVGDRLPPLRVSSHRLTAGDTLVMCTDGIARRALEQRVLWGEPGALAAKILAEHARPTDDALVLVVRYKA